ncbi:MAG TPA: rRNA maturation RNase YbeY [Candidatus Dormibacteraeota bacterium]|nr:rRNA maturation RNase YbeY [Candidatus Dormibacteraeota bacterium]
MSGDVSVVVTPVGGTGALTTPVRAYYIRPWRIDVSVRPGVGELLPVGVAALVRAVAAALEAAGAPRPASIGLVLSEDRELSELDREHMGVEGPTDVLSFPLLPPDAFPPHAGARRDADGSPGTRTGRDPSFVLPPGRRPHLGDVVVSVERAIAQAEAGRGGQTGDIRWSAGAELRLLVTHGVLHVCGWDHAEPDEESAMRALEHRLLASAPPPVGPSRA